MFNFLTSNRKKFWAERKINWEEQYLSTWNHPHRALIISALKSFHWISLWEVGCGAGANLVRIVREFDPRESPKQLGGSDINPDAIAVASKALVGARFKVESPENILLSDSATDVVLSDACLIYIDPFKIKKAIKEMVRISRGHILLCEFHGKNLWERWLLRLRTGYNAYDYEKLLTDAGCYDIQIIKMPPQLWEGFPWQPWGYVLLAKTTKI